MRSEMKTALGEVAGLKDSLALREAEIERLGRLFKGGENLSALKAKHEGAEAAQRMKALEAQNDHLNKENHRLNSQVGGKAIEDKAIGYSLQRENKQLQRRVEEAEAQLKSLGSYEHKKLVDLELFNAQKAELEKAQAEVNMLRTQMAAATGGLEKAELVRSAYNSDKAAFELAAAGLKEQLEQRTGEVERQAGELEEARVRMIAAEKKLGLLRAEQANWQQREMAERGALGRMRAEIGEREELVSTLRREKGQLEERVVTLQGERETAKRELERTVRERG